MKRTISLSICTLIFWSAILGATNSFNISTDSFSSKAKSVSAVSTYCTSGLSGTTFDVTGVTVVGTTLNNVSGRPNINASDGSYYTLFPSTGTTTCVLIPGNKYTFQVTTSMTDIISLWIDYNQNGTFESTEWTQVATSSIAASVSITIPSNALTGQTGLRIRTRNSGNQNGAADACSNFGSGCTEDYVVTIGTPMPTKPVANFVANSTITTAGSSIQFKDNSNGVPTSWKWTFQGGTPATATTQNPTVSYNANGIYNVKLVATNSLGADSITKAGYITVSNAVLLPVTGSSTITTCGVTVYDNGGTANYASTSDGTLTIYPGTTGNAVKLDFSTFNTYQYSDILYVYNGTSTSAPLIGSYSGTTIPGPFISTNSTGALTLRFTSSYSAGYPGFVAQSSCVPLVMQTVSTVSWSNVVDNNANTYSQSRTLNFTVKNDDVNSATLYAKVWGKLSSGGTYSLLSTASFIIPASSTSANQTCGVSGLSTKGVYDFKIELYNSSNVLLNTYDQTNNTLLAGLLFESAIDDITPSYCISGLGGGSFDISSVSITGTTLSNSSLRPAIRGVDGSYYTTFSQSGSNTCNLTSGTRYTLNVTTQNSDIVSVWIDYNHDLTLQPTEWVQVATSSISNSPSSVTFTIPNTALTGATRLRIRSNYTYNANGASNACTSFYSGCTEDYTINIIAPVLAKPIVDFSATTTNTSLGSTIQFYDYSTGAPATWKWTFDGGTPATSTSQNPSITYSTPGTYAVKLVAENSIGKDSLTKTGYITIVNTVNVPFSGANSITACGLTVYDNGGTSNYANGSNGTLTINPSVAGNAVRLLFSEFSTESCCDNLSIYNGTSTSAPLIGTYAGTTIPAPVVATNSTGALTLRFYSDGSSVSTGFVAQATCVTLASQYISTASWSNSIDYNGNGYSQAKTLNFAVRNDNVGSATIYAKVYTKISTASSYSLFTTTSNLTLTGNSTSATQILALNGFTVQGNYDVKIELYNSSNTIINSYDVTSNALLGAVKFESAAADGLPTYCTNNLGGGSFDITAVSINNTTLNNPTTRTAIRTLDGSYYTEFPASGSNTTTLYTGTTYTLNVTSRNTDNISMWIDYNQDLTFQPTEWVQVTSMNTNNTPSSITFTIPSSAVLGQTHLRIRTNSYGYTNTSNDACTSLTGGCTEDYNITIAIPVLAKPIPNFTASATSIVMGGSVQFTDLTTGIPSSWRWTFSGGTPSTSTVQNPVVTYNTPGTYNVKLIATNTQGIDSLLKSVYITVQNYAIVPFSGTASITTCGTTIYDNGGTSSYANYSNGTLTINPGTVGNAVKLVFSEFNLESCCDYLYIYNGTSTSAPLIGSYGGTTLPASIRATNSTGALTLRFTSDGSGAYSGFTALTSCVPLTLQYVSSISWTNAIDNNFNGYSQSKKLNIVANNGASSSIILYAKIYMKPAASGTYTLLTTTGNFTVAANSQSETILYNVSNVQSLGYYDFKIELYDSSNALISTYDLNDNTLLKNQGFEPSSNDGLGNYCTSGLGGSTYDITQVSITGTTLNNSSIRPTTGAYSAYSANGNYTCSLKTGSSNTVNVTTTNNDIVSIWIDYDHNGIFDAAEWALITTTSNNTLASAQVYIPGNALMGQTRMRVRTRSAGTSNYSADACTAFTSGCTEDYIVTIESGKTTAIDENYISEISIYPVPATDVLNISVPGFKSGTLTMMDLMGRKIVSKTVSGELFKEDVSALNKGIYIISVTMDNGYSIRKQVLIQK